jgi:3-phenylpropionate/cinnamic acid dioxygenase small subunit
VAAAGTPRNPPYPQYEVESFLYREAWLLDERRFDEWLDLFTDDARYVLLMREKAQRAEPGPGGAPVQVLCDDDKRFLALRVRRLDTNLAHSERPPSITRHLIAGVHVVAEDGDEVGVRSSFLVHQARLETDAYTFFGGREDRLRQVDGQWRIARRQAVLDHIHLPRALTIFF